MPGLLHRHVRPMIHGTRINSRGLKDVLSSPLITRELRVQSRKRATYSARTGWGLAAVAVLAFFTWSFPNQSANGRYLFSAVHLCLAAMILVLAPVGAA